MIKILLFDFFNVLLTTHNLIPKLNQELIEFLQPLDKKYQMHILSASPPQFVGRFKKGLQPPFNQFLSTKELKLGKDDPEIYRLIAKNLGVTTDQILFTDDQIHRVEAAQIAGCQTIHFTDTAKFITDFEKLI